MTETKFCISCEKDISAVPDSVVFNCPNCGAEIVRCGKCRSRVVPYTCKVCGFEGP